MKHCECAKIFAIFAKNMVMTVEDIQRIIATDETRVLEVKKTTGELKDGMHSACAFRNTDGGWLIFGIAPTSLKIIGQDVTDATRREIAQALKGLEPVVDTPVEYIDIPESAGKQVVAIHFNGWKRGEAPSTYHGCPYYKVESTTSVMPREMYDERLRESRPDFFAWEKLAASGIEISDLNEEHIRWAVGGGIEKKRLSAMASTEPVDKILSNLELLNDGKPNNAAAILFTKKLLGYDQLTLRMARFAGNDKNAFIDNQRVSGDFFDLLEAGEAFFFKHLSLSGEIVGFRREEKLEIPVEALREGLINALCHRQWEKYNMTVSIGIYDDRIEITNPGRLPSGITPQKLREPHDSIPYNPIIAKTLFRTSLLENWGSGTLRIIELCRAQNIPEPVWSENAGTVTLCFYRNNADFLKDFLKELTERQIDILELISQDFLITGSQLAEKLGVTGRTIRSDISALQKLGILHRENGRKDGKWVITKPE